MILEAVVEKVFPPTGMQIELETGNLIVSWSSSANAEQYRVILKEAGRPPQQVRLFKLKYLAAKKFVILD